MLALLRAELLESGLHIHPGKTKIITTANQNNPATIDIGDITIDVLPTETAHTYLGRRICGAQNLRGEVEIANRLKQARGKCNKYKWIFCNRHIHVSLKFRLFSSIIAPTLLYGTATLPVTNALIKRIDSADRRETTPKMGARRS